MGLTESHPGGSIITGGIPAFKRVLCGMLSRIWCRMFHIPTWDPAGTLWSGYLLIIGRISLKRIQGSQMGMTRCHPGGSIDPSGTPSPGTNLGSCMGLKVSHLGSYLEGSIILGRIPASIPPKTGGIPSGIPTQDVPGRIPAFRRDLCGILTRILCRMFNIPTWGSTSTL